MKVLPLSLMTASRSPWCLQICSRKRCATPVESTVVMVGMAWMHLDSLSTATRMALYHLVSGSSLMVSTEITSQWWVGIWFGVSFPTFCIGKDLQQLHAPCHVAGNIAGDAWPPAIAGDQLQCLPLPWVAGHHRVMVGMDNVMAELGVFWDIHVSPVHDQVSVSLPLI